MSSPARIFAVENTLAQVASRPGGKTMAEHAKAAEVRIEGVRKASLASLLEKAEAMASLAASGRTAEPIAALNGIYDLSNAIYGIAGSFGLKALAEACFSLCDVADGFRAGEKATNWPAIDVHVDGIRLLATLGDKGEAAGAEILEGLRRVRARVLAAAN